MTALKTLQQRFSDAMYRSDSAIVADIKPSTISPAGRMKIYRRNVFSAVTNALRLSYPVVEKLVGKDFFAAAGREFIKTSPPSSGNLDDYGADFGDFLASFPPAQSLPYLPDVARLEWLHHECALADAEDRSIRLFHSPYPVHRIWDINQEGADPDATVRLDEGAAWLMLTRSERTVHIHVLSEAEYTRLNSRSI